MLSKISFAQFAFMTLAICTIVSGVSVAPTHAAAWQDSESQDSNGEAAEVFDHHVHVLSPDLLRQWKSLGMPFSREDSAYTDPLGILERHKLSGAFLVSMAHLYTTEGVGGIEGVAGKQKEWVEKENDFVAECVAKAPGKFVGFYSVNPLADYAIDEMNRCLDNEHLTGLKLHLPACNVQLTDAENLKRMKTAFDWAVENDVPLLVHLFTADENNPDDLARIFWRELIQPRPSIEITLAHIGAAGGFNEISEAVLNGFLDLRTADKQFANARISFDLSGAILPTEQFGIPPTSDDSCLRLSKLIQQIGTAHFLFASDYPAFAFQESFDVLKNKLTAAEGQFDKILKKPSRWFSIKRELAEITLPKIRRELLKRAAKDQAARFEMIEAQGQANYGEIVATVRQIDKENRDWIKGQVEKHGWLSASKVGSDGAHSAWLIVQHADSAPKFQRTCLDLMTPLSEEEVVKSNVALLTDRVLLAEGKPQRYGTQFGMSNGEFEMKECEDVENLDQRRAAVGLSTIAEYKELLKRVYGTQAKPKEDSDDSKKDSASSEKTSKEK